MIYTPLSIYISISRILYMQKKYTHVYFLFAPKAMINPLASILATQVAWSQGARPRLWLRLSCKNVVWVVLLGWQYVVMDCWLINDVFFWYLQYPPIDSPPYHPFKSPWNTTKSATDVNPKRLTEDSYRKAHEIVDHVRKEWVVADSLVCQ